MVGEIGKTKNVTSSLSGGSRCFKGHMVHREDGQMKGMREKPDVLRGQTERDVATERGRSPFTGNGEAAKEKKKKGDDDSCLA